jgi:hypothetical protein
MGTEPKQVPADKTQSADAWERFERAVDVVAKSPPQHRPAKNSGKKRIKAPSSSAKA